MTHARFSPTRTALIAGNTLLEAARQKLFHFLLLLALVLVGSAQGLRDFNFGAPELKFLADFGFGAMAFFGAALTITATSQLFFAEIESRTVLTLLAKPVGRAEFVVGKLLGVAVVAAVFCALLTGLLAGVLWARETALMRELPDAFASGRVLHYGDLAAAGFIQWLKLLVVAAFTLLIASFAESQLYTVVAGFLVLVICYLQYLAQEVYGHSGSLLAQLAGVSISLLFPNFQLFNLADKVGAGGTIPWGGLARLTIYALGYAAAAGALAIYSFRRREI